MQKRKHDDGKLAIWQERLAQSDRAFSGEVGKMDAREALFNGDPTITQLVPGDKVKKTVHVRNIIFENIESQVSSSIPQPKVTPRRKKDERLADIIERFLRNELDRLPFETMNDMAERTVPIQGGVGFLCEWDNTKRSQMGVGELSVNVIHPKQFAPQPGIYTGIDDMDWFIIKLPTTKEAVWRKYGVNVRDEGEAEPDVRAAGSEDRSEDALTMYIGFEKNDRGGMNRYVWVNDVQLEDLDDYQARRQPVCAHCGKVRPLPGQLISNSVEAIQPEMEGGGPQERMAAQLMAERLAGSARYGAGEGGVTPGIDWVAGSTPQQTKYESGACPWCGGTEWTDEPQEYEQVMVDIQTHGGVTIPGATPGVDEMGSPVMQATMIPYYRPDVYPIVLQRSVSVYGQLLGNSDVDMIKSQQNTTNRLEQKIIDRILKAGTRVSLPDNAKLKLDPNDTEKWYLGSPADKNMIGVFDFTGNLQYEIAYLSQVYEESRQILGITDSFQGRHDTTATSGKAKEFSAAQAAGRLESKRTMKDAAYAKLFELMFKFYLAYADEPRPIRYTDEQGESRYAEFNRYDFLEQGEDGSYYWNDLFLFSCDTSAPLASNREAMWQETRMNLQSGAFGDPKKTQTLILFWSKMELLHYPGAAETKKFLEAQLEREQQAAERQAMIQQAAPQGVPQMAPGIPGSTM